MLQVVKSRLTTGPEKQCAISKSSIFDFLITYGLRKKKINGNCLKRVKQREFILFQGGIFVEIYV